MLIIVILHYSCKQLKNPFGKHDGRDVSRPTGYLLGFVACFGEHPMADGQEDRDAPFIRSRRLRPGDALDRSARPPQRPN